jgi:hypothetical protein
MIHVVVTKYLITPFITSVGFPLLIYSFYERVGVGGFVFQLHSPGKNREEKNNFDYTISKDVNFQLHYTDYCSK